MPPKNAASLEQRPGILIGDDALQPRHRQIVVTAGLVVRASDESEEPMSAIEGDAPEARTRGAALPTASQPNPRAFRAPG